MVHIPKWQVVLVLALLLCGLALAAPNLVSRKAAENIPGWLPHKQISLGLDLRGGSYLLLEAQLESVEQEHFGNLADSLRRELRKAKIGTTDLRVGPKGVSFTLRDPATRARAREIVGDLTNEFQVSMSDDGAVQLEFTELARGQLRSNVMDQTREILGIRIDETGVREPTIQRQGEERILIQLPGVDDPERMKEILGKTAKLTFRFVDENVTPGIDPTPRRKRVMVGGENLVDARSTTDQNNRPAVFFRFDTVGGRRFADATKKNVGRVFAIVLDGKVVSAPVIQEAILGGQGQITGRFTFQETEDLALLLRAGALPAPLVILEERTVGPGLGADSIRAGEIAAVLGLIFVVIFMALSYGMFGAIADVALVANLVLIAAALSGLQATLTLPGIAGIVLTIGMAVDANVLIFERIREEMHLGRGPVTAIDVGYRRALTTIIDSNLTTLIAAVLLFFFGTGPVKGFAVTLMFGIMTSMFTSIMVTRLIIVAWLRRRRPQALPI
jgi:protein-export membrane protein SecD